VRLGACRTSAFSRVLFAADGETLASLRSPPLQNQTAVLRTHSHQKPMRAPAMASVGLKRPLSLHCRLPSATVEKPSMVANAFQRCQSKRLCVTVGGFHERHRLSRTHARLVARQSFPHLWKKLWKITEFDAGSSFHPVFRSYPDGLAAKGQQNRTCTTRLPLSFPLRTLHFFCPKQ
jgi:hypothetical protein